MKELWPWLALAGLGAFHGLNPAMGWLFAVALGLHRERRSAVLMALPPIALGHALSIAIIAVAIMAAGFTVERRLVQTLAGLMLIGWAVFHHVYGHRHRVRVGMKVGQAGLIMWSFLMATAHGAGLMILPALMPLCLSASPASEIMAEKTVVTTLAVVGVHTAAMLLVTGMIAVLVYEWVGLAILRSAWVNLDLIWTVALVTMGIFLIIF